MAQPISAAELKTEEEGYGVVRAFDPKTGEMKWEFKMNDITWAGVLSTAPILCSAAGAKAISLRWTAATEPALEESLGGQVNSGPDELLVNKPYSR